MENYVGKMLDDRYELLELIGVGGMAVVYKALCHRLHRYVAIKILKDEFVRDEELRRRFYTESHAVAMLSHPNIVNVYDVSHSDGLDYIVMELVDGISLKEYLMEKGRLDWREVLHFSTQIAKALQHAHDRGVIHRDIKPHNIMLLKDGSIKVADFGIAQLIAAQTDGENAGSAIGSVHYVSPEQARGETVTAGSDLYSLGIVMYEMLTGTVPFDAESPDQVVRMHLTGGARPPREIIADIPAGIEQITMRAMQISQRHRYSSALQMLEALEMFRKNPTINFSADGSRTRTRHRPKKKNRLFSFIAVFIAVLVIGVAVAGLAGVFQNLMRDMFSHEEDIRIPNLYLLSFEAAKERFGKDFSIVDSEWVYDDHVAYGLILSQEPKADKSVKPGAEIRVTVSRGTEQLMMPNVIGISLSEAKLALSPYRLQIAVEYEESTLNNKADGEVLRSDPVFGTVLMPDQPVKLTVNRFSGADSVPVPALVGLHINAASVVLKNTGLVCGPLKYSVSKEAEGTVLFQSLPADSRAAKGEEIILEISSGETAKAQEPRILTQPADRAVTLGDAASLSAAATAEDGGAITYEWFRSASGTKNDLVSVGSGAMLDVPTTTAGVNYYCCKITNTYGDQPTEVYTDFACVTVVAKEEKTVRVFTLPLPAEGSSFEILILMDGAPYSAPFSVTAPPDGTAARSVQVAVEALGTHEVTICINGTQVWSSIEVF